MNTYPVKLGEGEDRSRVSIKHIDLKNIPNDTEVRDPDSVFQSSSKSLQKEQKSTYLSEESISYQHTPSESSIIFRLSPNEEISYDISLVMKACPAITKHKLANPSHTRIN